MISQKIPLRKVAEITGTNPEHLRQLCKTGKLKGAVQDQVSGVWATTVADVISYQLRGLSANVKIEIAEGAMKKDFIDVAGRETPKPKNRLEKGIKTPRIQKHKTRSYQKRLELKARFFEMYGRRCACCGESNELFLTFEHKNGRGEKSGKSKHTTYQSYLRAVREHRPDLYEVLCMNCNWAKGVYGSCPHKSAERNQE